MLKLLEIKELSHDEITEQVNKSRRELVDLRMKFTSRQLEDPSQIKKKRKEIARLLTVQTQKAGKPEQEQETKPIKNLKKEKKASKDLATTKKTKGRKKEKNEDEEI